MNSRRLLIQPTLRRLFALGILAAALLTLGGCVRMSILPRADRGLTGPMSEPRPVGRLAVPLAKDPTKIYRIGPRDIIRIDVRKEPTLSQVYQVTEEGNILLPNVGPFRVIGLTTSEVQEKLNQMLTEYIYEPDSKVGVQEYRSKLVYVVGQVNNPGPQIMRADMLTLQEAVFAAGLPTASAAIQRTHVITPAMENPVVRQIDLANIIYKGRMAENILLKPNDIVYVPSRNSINLAAALHELIGPFSEYLTVSGTAYGGGGGGGNNRFIDRFMGGIFAPTPGNGGATSANTAGGTNTSTGNGAPSGGGNPDDPQAR